jgi:hypothetical protein
MDPMRGLAASLLCLTLGAACVSPTDPLGREDALQEAQKKYTELIRWGDVQRAGMYVDPELRESFLELADSMADLRFTDFEIGEIDFDHDTATVSVTYRGYRVSEFVERSASEVQQWHRDGLKNDWLVRPELHDVVAAIEGRTVASRRN